MFLIIIICTRIPAAFERVPQSPLATGSAYSYFLGERSLIDFLSHPADLARTGRVGFSVFHSSSFGVAALGQYGFTLTAPMKGGTLGTGFATLGQTRYRETALSVGAGRRIGAGLDAGVLLNIFELYIANYQTDRTVAATVSVSYALGERVRWSLLFRNLNGPHLGRSRELLPQIVSTGVTVSPTARVTSALELEKDLEFENRYKFGLLWQPLSLFTVTTGFITHPAQATAAVSVEFPLLNPPYLGRVSYGLATHPELAISQVLSLQFVLR
ncbi:MAG: hypothetical protein ACE5HZ_06840 [Fidelibacterota bacterium]